MVKILEKSNILNVNKGIICHQVNCIGVMGAGIALQIRRKWPKVYELYKQECDAFSANPQRMLGHVSDIMVQDQIIVANCFGQVTPGNGCMTDYNAWDTILDKLKDLSNYFHLDLRFPWMIGCGLAGGDWNVMYKKIEDSFANSDISVFIHKIT